MTRQEYMQQLAALLAAMPEAERRDALDYYEEYFDAAGPEKEAQTIQELGSPQNVAEKIWEGTGAQFGTPMPDNSMPEQGSRRRKSPMWIVLAILAILIVARLPVGRLFRRGSCVASNHLSEAESTKRDCGKDNFLWRVAWEKRWGKLWRMESGWDFWRRAAMAPRSSVRSCCRARS